MKPCVIEIALTIPDNEAYTAMTTLRRLGTEISDLQRADVWRFETEDGYEAALIDRMRTLETIYNPNKHELRERGAVPEAGEVWIHEIAHGEEPGEGPVRIAGRTLPGVNGIERFTVWRLADEAGAPAPAEAVARATETLLCNPAFQVAT